MKGELTQDLNDPLPCPLAKGVQGRLEGPGDDPPRRSGLPGADQRWGATCHRGDVVVRQDRQGPAAHLFIGLRGREGSFAARKLAERKWRLGITGGEGSVGGDRDVRGYDNWQLERSLRHADSGARVCADL